MVQHRWMEAFPVFEFSAIEPSTEPKTAAQIQFRVGQRVSITLGGIQAITGVITVRQSAEDPERHALQLIGKGYSWQMAKSSIVRPYDFSGQGIEQVARTIAAETGVGVKTVGTVDGSPFPSLSVSPGEPAFDFLEHAARLRSTVLGSDEFGNILLIGINSPGQGADIAVGKNVKRINVIISNETVFANYWATGQMQGSDQINGQAAAQMLAGPIPGSDAVVSNLVAPSEIPGNPGDLQKRAAFEAQIHDATQIRITVLVYGWLQPSGDLWRVGQSYRVFAPEHLPDEWNGAQFSAQTITFQQDDENGTTTTLELVLPWLLNGNLFQTGLPTLPSPSDTVRFGDNFTVDQ
jgi:prophage tail gpP-like protein